MKRKQYVFIAFLFILTGLQAQVVRFDFPHFAGKEYIILFPEGNKSDTVHRGALDAQGQSVFVLPKSHSGFQGMAQFRLLEGGGLDLVLNKEKAFLIRCTEAQPNDKNIFYVGSAENNYLHQSYERQEKILERLDVIYPALSIYSPKDTLYPVFEKEKQRLETAYADLQKELKESKLYAARIRQIHNFLRGLGSRTDLTREEQTGERLDFITNKLDLNALYTSFLWSAALDQWMETETERADDQLMVADCKTLLSRAGNKHQELLNKLKQQYTQYGKENLLVQLGVKELLSPGTLAPALVTPNAKYTPVKSLIIFYESGCNLCENELLAIKGHYPALQEKGYEVISIAADEDPKGYEITASNFPWKSKYCDYKGFEGVNFRNYHVIGTPMLFVTDKEGKIVGKYAHLSDTGL